jgi:hypothetical protein
MSAEDLANDGWNDEAEDVLTQHWNLRAGLCPVSVAVNRGVWRVEDSFLVSSWSDDRPGVQRELELCQALTNSPRFSFPRGRTPAGTLGTSPGSPDRERSPHRKTAENVCRSTHNRSVQVPYSRDSSTMVSPTSKTLSRSSARSRNASRGHIMSPPQRRSRHNRPVLARSNARFR